MVVNTDGATPTEPESVSVAVPRHDLKQLRSILRSIVVGGVLGLASFVYFSIQQDHTNDRLEKLIHDERLEDEAEDAQTCVNAHERYHEFERLLRDTSLVGATVGADAHLILLDSPPGEVDAAHQLISDLLPGQLDPLLEQYPAPACDLEQAEAVLADR